jgi:hypothetical protein
MHFMIGKRTDRRGRRATQRCRPTARASVAVLFCLMVACVTAPQVAGEISLKGEIYFGGLAKVEPKDDAVSAQSGDRRKSVWNGLASSTIGLNKLTCREPSNWFRQLPPNPLVIALY